MKNKYLNHGGVYHTKKRHGDSPLWSDMLQVKQIYLKGRRMKVGMAKTPAFGVMLGVRKIL
jgi:hypothetical protein